MVYGFFIEVERCRERAALFVCEDADGNRCFFSYCLHEINHV